MQETCNLFKLSLKEIKKAIPDIPRDKSLFEYAEELSISGKLKSLKLLNDHIYKNTEIEEFINLNNRPGFMVPNYFLNPAISLVIDYFILYDSFTYSSKRAESLINNFNKSVQTKRSSVVHIALLIGFTTKIQRFSISPNICIRRLSKKDRDLISKLFPNFQKDNEIEKNQYIIEYKSSDLTIEEQHNDIFVRSLFDDVLDCLKALKPAYIDISSTYSYPQRFGEISVTPSTHRDGSKEHVYTNTYAFNYCDEKLFRTVYNFNLQSQEDSSKDINRLLICKSRILESMEFTRTNDRDRLVNYVIALDALFGDNGDSIRYKVSMRGSAFLERESNKRITVKNLISDAYKLRNKIVHGSNYKEKRLRNLLPDLSDTARRSFIKFAEFYLKKGTVISHDILDDMLLINNFHN